MTDRPYQPGTRAAGPNGEVIILGDDGQWRPEQSMSNSLLSGMTDARGSTATAGPPDSRPEPSRYVTPSPLFDIPEPKSISDEILSRLMYKPFGQTEYAASRPWPDIAELLTPFPPVIPQLSYATQLLLRSVLEAGSYLPDVSFRVFRERRANAPNSPATPTRESPLATPDSISDAFRFNRSRP